MLELEKRREERRKDEGGKSMERGKETINSAQITKHYGTHATAKTRTTTIEKSCIRAYLPIYFLPTCMKLK